MPLVEITAEDDVAIELAYAGPHNFTGRRIYRRAGCYLHADAARLLRQAAALARPLGLKLKILDAFRPTEAQWVLWRHLPDPVYIADPGRGSVHSMGAAVDLTLIDRRTAAELDMGTPFDFLSPQSGQHGKVSAEARANRKTLADAMRARGFIPYDKEWWHFTLRNEPFPNSHFDFPVR